MRVMLYEAAQSMPACMAKWSSLKAWAMRRHRSAAYIPKLLITQTLALRQQQLLEH